MLGEMWKSVKGVEKCGRRYGKCEGGKEKCVGVWGKLEKCGKVGGGEERCGEMCWVVRGGVE